MRTISILATLLLTACADDAPLGYDPVFNGQWTLRIAPEECNANTWDLVLQIEDGEILETEPAIERVEVIEWRLDQPGWTDGLYAWLYVVDRGRGSVLQESWDMVLQDDGEGAEADVLWRDGNCEAGARALVYRER